MAINPIDKLILNLYNFTQSTSEIAAVAGGVLQKYRWIILSRLVLDHLREMGQG